MAQRRNAPTCEHFMTKAAQHTPRSWMYAAAGLLTAALLCKGWASTTDDHPNGDTKTAAVAGLDDVTAAYHFRPEATK